MKISSKLFRFFINFSVVLVLACVLIIPRVHSQQLTVKNRAIKIGYIDHSKLRKKYVDFSMFKDSIRQEARSATLVYEASKKSVDSAQPKKLLPIEDSGMQQKQELLVNYQSRQKQLSQYRIGRMQEYEKRIKQIIREMAIKEGFTSILPLPKDGSLLNGSDITDSLIQKINQK